MAGLNKDSEENRMPTKLHITATCSGKKKLKTWLHGRIDNLAAYLCSVGNVFRTDLQTARCQKTERVGWGMRSL